MIKFRAEKYFSSDAIEQFEVIKETPNQITYLRGEESNLRERRENKCGAYHQWHDTWEEAHQFLIEDAIKRINHIRDNLGNAERKLIMI